MPELTRRGDVFVLDISNTPDGDHRFTYDRIAALDAALTEVEASTGPAALVITAQGKFFSNGLVPELFVEPDYTPSYQRLLARLLVTEVPTVGALNGHTYAGALLFALTFDERYARTERGFLCLPEAQIKVPFTAGLAALVMARLAPQVAHRAMVLSHRFDADSAVEAGLIDGSAPVEDLLDIAVARAAELAALRGPVLASIKTARYGGVVDALHRTEQLAIATDPQGATR
jgi:enoyl-CoA hydratase/carnithine racemase